MTSFFKKGVYDEQEEETKNFKNLPDFDPENAQTYLDIAIGNEGDEDYQKGRVVIEVFTKQVPKTASNFVALCHGRYGEMYHYKGCTIKNIMKGIMMRTGDTTVKHGDWGTSIYGGEFADEGIWFPHSHRGVVSMASLQKDKNNTQFFITFAPMPHMDGEQTVFGRVINGYDILAKVE